MGLDVYLGPLSRYYSGDWETVIERQGREQGFDVEVIRAKPLATDDPQIARRRVIEWQGLLSDTLMGAVGRISWTDSPTDEYITDKPDWGPFVALCLLAAHADGLISELPTRVPTAPSAMRLWADLGRRTQVPEPLAHRIGRLLGRASTYAPPPRRYEQVVGPEVWLPLDAAVVIETNDAVGVRRTFGSASALLTELRQLNAETFAATPDILAEWSRNGHAGDSFEPAARFGLAVIHRFASEAVDRRLPLVLDY